MKNLHKGSTTLLIIVVIILLLLALGLYGYTEKRDTVTVQDPNPTTENPTIQETMTIDIYIQDKEAAMTTDCGITKKEIHTIPWTSAVADASLKLLFNGDLYKFGVYKNVNIVDGVAKVMLESENNRAGYPIGSLTSCEVRHLQAVLHNTLTQYETIKKVELYSPEGKIEF